MKIVSIMQPGYFPWIGFFELMQRSDIFIVYDIVKFDKNGWRNRNRIKNSSGPVWLTVPVHAKNSPALKDIKIDNSKNWQNKHLKSIEINYKKARYFNDYFPKVKEILSREWESLGDLNLATIDLLASSFNINPKLLIASRLGVEDEISGAERVEKLLKLCQLHGDGADVFYEPAGGKDYLASEHHRFKELGMDLVFQDIDPVEHGQLHGDFLPNLSALDLLFNEGPASFHIIKKSGGKVKIKKDEDT